MAPQPSSRAMCRLFRSLAASTAALHLVREGGLLGAAEAVAASLEADLSFWALKQQWAPKIQSLQLLSTFPGMKWVAEEGLAGVSLQEDLFM